MKLTSSLQSLGVKGVRATNQPAQRPEFELRIGRVGARTEATTREASETISADEVGSVREQPPRAELASSRFPLRVV